MSGPLSPAARCTLKESAAAVRSSPYVFRWEPPCMIRVLIADDHDIVREGVKQIVSETSDIVVSGEARSGAEALNLARAGAWDVIILDLNLPDRSGLDVLTQLRS